MRAMVILVLLCTFSAASQAQVMDALSRCLREGVAGEPPIRKNQAIGGTRITTNIVCKGETARELYRAVEPPMSTQIHKDDKYGERTVRYFGHREEDGGYSPSSQCLYHITSRSGEAAGDITCFLGVDLSEPIVTGLGTP